MPSFSSDLCWQSCSELLPSHPLLEPKSSITGFFLFSQLPSFRHNACHSWPFTWPSRYGTRPLSSYRTIKDNQWLNTNMNDIDIKCFWSQGKAKHSVIEFYRREDIKNIKKCIRGKRTSEWKCRNGSKHIDNKKNEHRRLLNWEGLHPLGGSFKDFFHVWGHTNMIGSWKNILMKKLKLIWRDWGFIWEQLCQLMV